MQPTGGTLRDALVAGAQQTGTPHPDLLGDPLPEEIKHVWGWFDELKMARANSGFGVSAISFTEMLAWAQLTGRCPTSFEVQMLRDLDLLYMKATAARIKEAELTV